MNYIIIMKNKIIWLFPLLSTLFMSLSMNAQSYRLNDTLYIWDMRGADLVQNPDNPDDITRKYYYGTPARVVDTQIHKFPHNKNIDSGLSIQGHWVKVILERDTGYVFDAHLSHLRPFDLRSDAVGQALVSANYNSSENIEKETRSSTERYYMEGEKQTVQYTNGITWMIQKLESCEVEKYKLPNVDFKEAYLWMMAVYSNYFHHSATSMMEPAFLRMNGNKYEFIVREGKRTSQITLYREGGHYWISAFNCLDAMKEN